MINDRCNSVVIVVKNMASIFVALLQCCEYMTESDKSKQTKRWVVVGVVAACLVTAAAVALIVLLAKKKKRENRQITQRGLAVKRINLHLMSQEMIESDIASRNLDHSSPEFTDTIFVAISSYRDSELCLTLKDLFLKASNPQRVFVGVFEQTDPTDPDTCHAKNVDLSFFNNTQSSSKLKDNVRVQTVHYKEARGPTWARHLCEKLWRGETWHLMTDSHMRFEPGWDSDLIKMAFDTPVPNRSVITMYPEGYTRQESVDKTSNETSVKYDVAIRKGYRRARFKYFNDQGIPEFESLTLQDKSPEKPTLCAWWGACFHFAHSDALRMVPFSPNTPHLFFGEEIFMGCRYWTHGFNLYAPTKSVCYHLWTREHRKTYWEHDVVVQRDKSIQLVKDIMVGKVVDNVYGLGRERSWQDFWNYVGLDLVAKKTTRPPDPWTLPPGFRVVNPNRSE